MGLRLWGPRREADLLEMQLGARRTVGEAEVGEYSLRIACAWRIAGPTSILVGSSDLFTPADPDAELETFDWDVAGASWWDQKIAELDEQFTGDTVVSTFMADSYGGVRLVCTGGLELEIFPNSSPAPHVETEFWRLVRMGERPDFVAVGTAGVELVQPA